MCINCLNSDLDDILFILLHQKSQNYKQIKSRNDEESLFYYDAAVHVG